MKKVKFLLLSVVVAGAFALVSCDGATETKDKEKEKDEKKNKDEESEFYDKDAVGDVIYFNDIQKVA